MVGRVIFRICHFIIYSLLFVIKFTKLKIQYHLSTIKWLILLAFNRFDSDTIIQTCTTGNRLGTKTLSHTAIVLNNFEIEDNNPPLAQMTKLAEVIGWLLVSQSVDSKSKGCKTITLFDKQGLIDQFADLLYALLKIRLAVHPQYTCKMTSES